MFKLSPEVSPLVTLTPIPHRHVLSVDLAAIHGFNRNFGQLDAPEVKTARVELTKVQMAVKAKLLDDSRSQVPTVGHALAAIFGMPSCRLLQ